MGFENFIMGELNMFPDLLKKIIREGQSCEQRQVKINNDKLQDYKNAIESQGRNISNTPAGLQSHDLHCPTFHYTAFAGYQFVYGSLIYNSANHRYLS